MNEELPPLKRFIFCEQCGGDKPWARHEWVPANGFFFCSLYCKVNYDAFLFRMMMKGKKLIRK